MRWILKRQIIDALLKKLNGNIDIVLYILEFNNITKDIIQWNIEKDFYNWLNWDSCLRNDLCLSNPDYFHYEKLEKLKYYNKNYIKLGLTKYKFKNPDALVRKKSLTKCFNDKWWKTTEKNFIYWDLIHNHIKMTIY